MVIGTMVPEIDEHQVMAYADSLSMEARQRLVAGGTLAGCPDCSYWQACTPFRNALRDVLREQGVSPPGPEAGFVWVVADAPAGAGVR